MEFKMLIRYALIDLKRNGMRSVLTSIGIIIGVSSVIILIGLGASAKNSIRDRLMAGGTTTVIVGQTPVPFTDRHIDELKRYFPVVQYISPYVQTLPMKICVNNTTDTRRVQGVSNDYIYMRGWRFLSGRTFTDNEISGGANVVIIGYSVSKIFFGSYVPIGQEIDIADKKYRIIGVIEETELFGGKSSMSNILLPFTNAAYRFCGKRVYNGIHLSARNEEDVEKLADDIRDYFRADHRLARGQKDDFDVTTSLEKIKTTDNILMTITYLLVGVASISLFVGGVGIMNIMLVSVSERTREIGIRMAVGAKQRDILSQFISQACLLSSIGGIAGIILGLCGYFIISHYLGWDFIFSLPSILISFATSVAVGVFFGYYPASKASGMEPMDALRHEF